jgi:hypothetical protein
MDRHRFWYVDDAQRVRWAVRISGAVDRGLATEPRIVFTSGDRQVHTPFELEKEQSQLSRYEILELLAEAKRRVVSTGNENFRAAA